MTRTITFHLRNQLLLSDERFDQLFPTALRERSQRSWTPIRVAVRACALLAPKPRQRILDVGAGVGKLCLVGAVARQALWCGIERDQAQVDAATRAARRLAVEQHVQFIHGDAFTIDWASYDGLYFFNPFFETVYEHQTDVSARMNRYRHDVDLTRERLAQLQPGTRVVTNGGFGGDMPTEYVLVNREPAEHGELCLWTRRARPRRSRPRDSP